MILYLNYKWHINLSWRVKLHIRNKLFEGEFSKIFLLKKIYNNSYLISVLMTLFYKGMYNNDVLVNIIRETDRGRKRKRQNTLGKDNCKLFYEMIKSFFIISTKCTLNINLQRLTQNCYYLYINIVNFWQLYMYFFKTKITGRSHSS